MTGKIAQWIILLQKFDLKIIHCANTKHENVNFLSRMKKEVEFVSKDNDFPEAMLMSIDIDNEPEKYKDIIRYLKGMNFPEDATKQIRTIIAYKSRSYTLIGQLLYFCERNSIFYHAVRKTVIPKLLRELHKIFKGDIVRDKLQ